jgi:hypothetical protein
MYSLGMNFIPSLLELQGFLSRVVAISFPLHSIIDNPEDRDWKRSLEI